MSGAETLVLPGGRPGRERLRQDQEAIFRLARAGNIGVGVSFPPVRQHPYSPERCETSGGMSLAAEAAADRLPTLPQFPGLTDDDVADAMRAGEKVLQRARC